MTKGDRTKMEFYFKMNIYEFLNHLCYLQDKTDSKQ